ncbi:MAG: transketolase family protein [Clostridia bacterium]|nr:transketolase family protein [Clostridia bacterium]
MTHFADFVQREQIKAPTIEGFGKELCVLGETNDKIVGLAADLAGSTKVNLFGAKFPDRYFNVGIAEQNMFGIAAGLAKCGYIPFATTFSVFASLRALDQIHTDICYQNLNVKIVGTHGGTSFGTGGSTHHAIEDFAVIRSLANMTLICPADMQETALATRAAVNHYGPYYIRLNRGTNPVIYNTDDYGFAVGKAVKLAEGKDATIIACGSCVYQALKASEILEKEGISVCVLNMHTIKPIDKDAILSAIKDTGVIVTAEDHTVIGGLGSAVADVIAENGAGVKFKKLGIQDVFSPMGAPDDLLAIHGINDKGIAEAVKKLL